MKIHENIVDKLIRLNVKIVLQARAKTHNENLIQRLESKFHQNMLQDNVNRYRTHSIFSKLFESKYSILKEVSLNQIK